MRRDDATGSLKIMLVGMQNRNIVDGQRRSGATGGKTLLTRLALAHHRLRRSSPSITRPVAPASRPPAHDIGTEQEAPHSVASKAYGGYDQLRNRDWLGYSSHLDSRDWQKRAARCRSPTIRLEVLQMFSRRGCVCFNLRRIALTWARGH
jgi:hypothetical protein